MLIGRISPLTGKFNTMDLPVTPEQMARFEQPNRPVIQAIFPDLTADQREFLMTGYTAEDWETMFADAE